MNDDYQTDLLVGMGGISAPIWLHSLNEWVSLCVGILGIILVSMRIYKNMKDGE